jgi:hypothetical protein
MQVKWANMAAFEALQDTRCANDYPSILLFGATSSALALMQLN